MPWDESVWLVDEILTDPSAHLTAAVLGWDHPASHEWLALAQIVDATVAGVAKKPKAWPRPWKSEQKTRAGRTNLTPDDAKAVLARLAGRGD